MTDRTYDLQAYATTVTGAAGDEIEAYAAVPDGPGPFPGVVVIHHMPGFDRATEEVVRRFAAAGFACAAPHLIHRVAPGADPDDAAAASRAAGGTPDDQLVGDVAGTAAFLRALPSATGAVGAIGFCSGGRQAVLSGIAAPVDAVVDCYGAFVTEPPPEDFPIPVTALADRISELRTPLLGLFGADDQHPSPAAVAELERLLTEHGKTFETHTYDGAGHGFFAVDRPSYRPQAATDGWSRVLAFLRTHLSAA